MSADPVARWLVARERVEHWAREADRALLEARAGGVTFEELGRRAGISRQAVWQAERAASGRRGLLHYREALDS